MVSRHYRVSDCCLTANTHYTTVYHDNPSGVDNFGYSPIQTAVAVLLYRTNS